MTDIAENSESTKRMQKGAPVLRDAHGDTLERQLAASLLRSMTAKVRAKLGGTSLSKGGE